jgi:2-polyprenyl-3-methyl-5-hydroxy-6-metoxy-1,4-benzoquinol methylase
MATKTSIDSLSPIREIMERHGVNCSPEEFHAAVNVTFHNFESEVYDHEHSDMWASLPAEFERLSSDCLTALSDQSDLNLLDIGCGTGLATDCLLRTGLADKIKNIDLLDTSRAMLEQTSQRANGWGRPFTIHEGLLDVLPKGKKYSIIVTCSVLHHVPDLQTFLETVESLQTAGGVYIHLQDPNGNTANDPQYRRRLEQFEKENRVAELIRRFGPRKVISKLYRELTGNASDDYCARTNNALLNAGVIASPLSVAEIYSITDIHVQDKTGISIPQMKRWMPNYDLLSVRSYAYFGALRSNLPANLQKLEDDLALERALNGAHIGAAWKLRS